MVTLYIIGAGCSRNYEQCISPVADLKPPLNKDFFKMAKKVIDYYDLNFMLSPILGLDPLVRDINQLFGIISDTRSYNTNILNDDRLKLEDIMNFYYLQGSILERDIEEFEASNNHRVRALNDLLAYTLTESLDGPICNKHLLLAEEMQEGDIVWSFNYDLLMDNALYSRGKLTDSGYLLRFDYVLAEGEWQRVSDNKSPITMLKLHGSLNWLRCNSCGRYLLIRNNKSDQEIWKKIRGEEVIRCPKCIQHGSFTKNLPIHIVNTHSDEVKSRLASIFVNSPITNESPDDFFANL